MAIGLVEEIAGGPADDRLPLVAEQFRKGRVYVDDLVFRIEDPQGVQHLLDREFFPREFPVSRAERISHAVEGRREMRDLFAAGDGDAMIEVAVAEIVYPFREVSKGPHDHPRYQRGDGNGDQSAAEGKDDDLFLEAEQQEGKKGDRNEYEQNAPPKGREREKPPPPPMNAARSGFGPTSMMDSMSTDMPMAAIAMEKQNAT